MSIVRSSIVGLVLVAVFALTAGAKETEDQAKPETVAELKNQTHCPVMGGKIDSTFFTDIQGQRVYHCCPGCAEKLKADPDKYFRKAAAESVLFENIQTTCPVSGKELKDKSVFIDYEGRRIVFCCEGCIDPFLKNPQEYLKKMDQSAKVEEKASVKDHKAKGHSRQDHCSRDH